MKPIEINKQKSTRSDLIFDIIIYFILAVIVSIELYPLIYTISASVSNPLKVMTGEMWLLPKGISGESYLKVLHNEKIWTGYFNTITYTIINLCISLTLTMLAAYPLSRKDLKGRSKFMAFMVFTMFFQGGMIPTYLCISKLGLVNTLWAAILPLSLNTYNIIVTRSFLESSIPYELYESAHIDGCSNTRMLISIVIPLSKPVMAVMVLFYSVSQWNDFFNALIYISDKNLFPLQIILREILLQSSTGDMLSTDASVTERLLQAEQLKYAVIILASVPMLILYPFVQRFFVKGIMIGAVKG